MSHLQVDAGSVGETLLGLFTCYIVRLCVKTRYEKHLVEIRKFIDEQNRKVFQPAGLSITDPIERGLRVVRSNDAIGRLICKSCARIFS